jgi:hypothetical protein
MFNTINEHLNETKDKKKGRTIIEKTFQGELELSSITPKVLNGQKIAGEFDLLKKSQKFFFLSPDLPNIPLFKEQHQVATIQ